MTIQLRKLCFSPAPIPADDQSRLEELYSLRILGTAAEERFDRYTRLAATILDVPIALVSLIDRDRQWFKSAHGLDVEETPREMSFCGHAIVEKEGLLIVPDALDDPRFADNPFVVGEPGIRFYAGFVVHGPHGQPVGTCCAIDTRSRTLTDTELSALEQIARMIEHEVRVAGEADELAEKLRSHGLRDSMTGLPNLSLFTARLDDAIVAGGHGRILLALLRIEQFGVLEAAVGRAAAHYVVSALADRIRESTADSILLGQPREDKLSVMVPMSAGQDPKHVLADIFAAVEAPFLIEDHRYSVRVSIGASMYPRHGKTADRLLKRARTALSSMPLSQQSGFRLYQTRDGDAASRSFRIESELETAIERDEFRLVYQPKADTKTREMVGAEALIRWHSKSLGDVSPGEFIPVAERSGQIVELGTWVLAETCRQVAAWRGAGLGCPQIAVNLASEQLRQPDFCENVQRTLERYSIGGRQLNLELTESSLVEDIEGAIKIMHRLRRMGITFSIDDFGTGFSSLSYLGKMPIGLLKIDRSFIAQVTDREEDMKLVRSIVHMGHDLGVQVVAEGVETEEQLAFLLSVDCDQVQGYLIGRPLAADRFEERIGKGLAGVA